MRCSLVTITWYPGAIGTTDDPLVLLSPSHYVPDPAALAGMVEQLVDSAETVRGAAVANYARGNVRSPLSWREVRRITDPMEAQEVALTKAAGLPTSTGWCLIELDGRETTWSLSSAVIRNLRWEADERRRLLFLDWSVDGGVIAPYDGEEAVTIYAPGELSEGPVTNRGAILRGPNRTYPAA